MLAPPRVRADLLNSLEVTRLSKASQRKTDTMCYHSYVEASFFLMIQMNCFYKTEADSGTLRKQLCGYQSGGGEGSGKRGWDLHIHVK